MFTSILYNNIEIIMCKVSLYIYYKTNTRASYVKINTDKTQKLIKIMLKIKELLMNFEKKKIKLNKNVSIFNFKFNCYMLEYICSETSE
jgi:hypothetical protein